LDLLLHNIEKYVYFYRSSSQTTTPVSKGDPEAGSNDDFEENQILNQNLVNFNVPPTPKKLRQLPISSTTLVTTTTTDGTDSSSGIKIIYLFFFPNKREVEKNKK